MDDSHFIFPPGMPEEDKEKMKKYIEAQENNSLVYQHRVSHFFDSLNEEQLSIMRDIIASVAGDERLGGYYGGITTMMLVKDHGYCMACGGKHDEELAKMVQSFKDDQEPEPSGESWDRADLGPVMLADLAEYRVNLLDPPPKVVCRDCGMVYPSLEDRMLKAPDDCSGCFIKAAHG